MVLIKGKRTIGEIRNVKAFSFVQFASPTCAVRAGPRQSTIVIPFDYIILGSLNTSGLFCHRTSIQRQSIRHISLAFFTCFCLFRYCDISCNHVFNNTNDLLAVSSLDSPFELELTVHAVLQIPMSSPSNCSGRGITSRNHMRWKGIAASVQAIGEDVTHLRT